MAFKPLQQFRGTPSERCFACGQRILVGDSQILLYGEHYHYDCAFYRARGAPARLSDGVATPPKRLSSRLRPLGRKAS